MKNRFACPDFPLLSQFLDHELGKKEEAKIKRHLEECSNCRAKVERTGRMEEMVRIELTGSSFRLSLQPRSSECLSPEFVSGYVQHVLSVEDEIRVERHLQACDACLNEVMEAFRISSSLASAKREPVPATLKAQVASLWERRPEGKKTAPIPVLVILITQKGLKLLEKYLTPTLLGIWDVEEIFTPIGLTPALAFRSGEVPSVLNLSIYAGTETGLTEIKVTAVQEGEGIALKMTFLSSEQEALADQRIFLRQRGRSIFSARTDKDGILRVPLLEPGIYEVACPGMNVTFQLELRS